MARVESNTGRRRVPRRSFDAQVGVLIHGVYAMDRSIQVGEGGMMIACGRELSVGVQVVANFFLPTGVLIIVRGVVRSVVPVENGQPKRYGIEFLNLDFQYKREVRNFVAAATRLDGPLSL